LRHKNDINESTEDYVEAVLRICHEKKVCRSIDVADSLEISRPSVSIAVKKLEAEGLLTVDESKYLHLSAEGRKLARETYKKHCFFKNLLLDAGVDEQTAETEACSMEHDISSSSFHKLQKRLEKR
jgi:Mn-dependent DtxR family transcriptional regulator